MVVAHAGYGKTSVLSQAVAEMATDRARIDYWLQCDAADGAPGALGAALVASIGREAKGEAVTPGFVADLLAWHAPDQVCLILDDVHRLAADSPAWAFLDELIDVLPHNGHLLLSGRVNPVVTLARREVVGSVERIGLVDLEYNDDELASLGGESDSVPNDAARWPAVRALGGAASTSAAQFLIEEVIAGWDPDRRTAVTALAHLSSINDAFAVAASSGATAAELLGDIPLVQRAADGSYQLHDLWRDALVAHHLSSDVSSALERIGRLLLLEQRFVHAAEIFQAAHSERGVADAAERLVSMPFIMVSSNDLERMLEIVTASLSDSAIPELVASAIAGTIGDERLAVEGFQRAALAAAERRDEVVEVLALQQAINLWAIIDSGVVPEWIGERAAVLTARGRIGALHTSVLARYRAARAVGDVDLAAATLQELVPPANDRDIVTYTFGMTDLGRPELIDVPGLSTGDLDVAKGRIDLAVGVWLRGLVSPEQALELGRPLVGDATSTGYAHIEVQANAVFALIALAAGRHSEGRHFADTAMARASSTGSASVRGFAELADVMCTIVEQGERHAAERLDDLLGRMPIEVWPPRPYLFALPAVYLLAPQTRTALDRCRFGPALEASLAAGRALVALREGDAAPAARLAWDRPQLLRAHVLPCHLGSLVAAVAAVGHADVGPVLAALPDVRHNLDLATAVPDEITARWAAAQVARLPPRPEYDLGVDVLGPLRLRRGDTEVVDAPWLGRQRVRQLMAFLVVHRRVSRRDTVEALWPELEVATALSNLRVNLTHLHGVLQPGRGGGVLPWFVRSDGDWLILADDGVTVDADLFDERLRHARSLDDAGRSARAREGYAAAIALDRGGFLDDWPDAPWAHFERLRLRAASITARCRLGELLLASGEPEHASQLAEAVLRFEPLQERAGRLLVHALAAQGDRATAFRVAGALVDSLRSAGLRPEPDTDAMVRGYGVLPA